VAGCGAAQALDEDVVGYLTYERLRDGLALLASPPIRICYDDWEHMTRGHALPPPSGPTPEAAHPARSADPDPAAHLADPIRPTEPDLVSDTGGLRLDERGFADMMRVELAAHIDAAIAEAFRCAAPEGFESAAIAAFRLSLARLSCLAPVQPPPSPLPARDSWAGQRGKDFALGAGACASASISSGWHALRRSADSQASGSSPTNGDPPAGVPPPWHAGGADSLAARRVLLEAAGELLEAATALTQAAAVLQRQPMQRRSSDTALAGGSNCPANVVPGPIEKDAPAMGTARSEDRDGAAAWCSDKSGPAEEAALLQLLKIITDCGRASIRIAARATAAAAACSATAKGQVPARARLPSALLPPSMRYRGRRFMRSVPVTASNAVALGLPAGNRAKIVGQFRQTVAAISSESAAGPQLDITFSSPVADAADAEDAASSSVVAWRRRQLRLPVREVAMAHLVQVVLSKPSPAHSVEQLVPPTSALTEGTVPAQRSPSAQAITPTHRGLLPRAHRMWVAANTNGPGPAAGTTPDQQQPEPAAPVTVVAAPTSVAAVSPASGSLGPVLELVLWPDAGAERRKLGSVVEGAELDAELVGRLCLAAGSLTCLPRLDQLRLTPVAAVAVTGISSPCHPSDGSTAAEAAAAARVYRVEVLPSRDLGFMAPEPGKLAKALVDAAATGLLLELLQGFTAVSCLPL
jgi:hypothetical protein